MKVKSLLLLGVLAAGLGLAGCAAPGEIDVDEPIGPYDAAYGPAYDGTGYYGPAYYAPSYYSYWDDGPFFYGGGSYWYGRSHFWHDHDGRFDHGDRGHARADTFTGARSGGGVPWGGGAHAVGAASHGGGGGGHAGGGGGGGHGGGGGGHR